MASTSMLLNFVRFSSPLLRSRSVAAASHQIRWCSVKYDDKYYENVSLFIMVRQMYYDYIYILYSVKMIHTYV